MTLDDLNTGAVEVLRPALLACCDVPRWADDVLAARPFGSADELAAAADRAARSLSDDEVERALAAHPRIGERADGTSTEARWSRGEQAAVVPDTSTAAVLAEANLEYEQRFGRVFLICATGLTADQVLADLRSRLSNDDEAEAAVVADELRKIAVLRVRKLVAS